MFCLLLGAPLDFIRPIIAMPLAGSGHWVEVYEQLGRTLCLGWPVDRSVVCMLVCTYAYCYHCPLWIDRRTLRVVAELLAHLQTGFVMCSSVRFWIIWIDSVHLRNWVASVHSKNKRTYVIFIKCDRRTSEYDTIQSRKTKNYFTWRSYINNRCEKISREDQ